MDHEYIIAQMGVSQIPTLDFNEANVERIAAQLAQETGLASPQHKA